MFFLDLIFFQWKQRSLIHSFLVNSEITKRSKKLVSLGIEVELGQHTKNILSADLWIISPGISQKSQIFLDAKSNGIPIISEIEFASWFANHPIVSVTGSNGKKTTVHH